MNALQGWCRYPAPPLGAGSPDVGPRLVCRGPAYGAGGLPSVPVTREISVWHSASSYSHRSAGTS